MKWVEGHSRWFVFAAGIPILLLVGLLEYAIGSKIGFSLFYLLPIALAAWLKGRREGITLAVAAAAIGLLANISSGTNSSHPTIPFWDGLIRVGIFSIVVELLIRLKATHRSLAEAVEEQRAFLCAELAERTQSELEIRAEADRQRQRIAYDLHDGVCQFLTGVAFKAKVLRENLAAESLPHIEETQQIVNLINAAVGQVRNVLNGAAPPDVQFDELLGSLGNLARETENLFEVQSRVTANRTTLPVSTPVGMHLFRFAQEATNNAIKHAAASQIEIEVIAEEPRLTLIIRDNGRGFVAGPRVGNGLGLRSMRHRATLLGGTMEIVSEPGKGTQVQCVIPNASFGNDPNAISP